MRTRTVPRVAPALAMAAVVTLVAVPSAHAALLKGSIQGFQVMDEGNTLRAYVLSEVFLDDPTHTGEGLNTHHSLRLADADEIRDRCEATVTVTGPDGASGSTTLVIPTDVNGDSEVRITDKVPGTAWHAGDVDHLVGHIACYNVRTGGLDGLVALDENLVSY